jgi:hypothetical protein
MAIVPTITVGPFLGVDNRRPDHRLAATERGRKAGDYLRNAVNVDLSASGTLTRRPGTTLAVAGTNCHSLWSEADARLFVEGDTLHALDHALAKTALRTGLTPGMRMSYCVAGTDVYYTNGVVLERLRNGVCVPAGVPVPNPAPTVTATNGGSLPEGRYQVALTRRAADGEESGSTVPVQVSVPADGVITVSGIDCGTDYASVYLTPPNGDLLFRADVLPVGQTSLTIPVMPQLGGRCQTLLMRPMPAGHIVRYRNGRLLVAAGDALYYSEPYAPALHNPARGYIPFAARITVVEPVEGGVFVVTDKTWFLAGDDIDKADPVEVLPYGAVEGTGGRSPVGTTAWWFSTRGMVEGAADGSVKNLQEEHVAVGSAAAGATHYREHDGMRHLVSSLFGTEASVGAASSWMEAEIVRKENML